LSSVVRLAKPYLTTGGATIHNRYAEIVKEGDTLITLEYERLKLGDMIQGLPKVEQHMTIEISLMFNMKTNNTMSSNS
jgi:hypothetical protein